MNFILILKRTVLRKIFFYMYTASMPIWNLLCSFCGFNCVLEHADIISSTWNIVFTFNNMHKYSSSPSDFNSAVPLWLHSVSCLFGFLMVIQGFCFWVWYYFHLSLSIKYGRVSFCGGLFYDSSLLRPLLSRTKHSRLVVHHCCNSGILSVLSALIALFQCVCVSSYCILVLFY